jgi:hypothetical protein
VADPKFADAPPEPSVKKATTKRAKIPVPAGKASLIRASAKSGLKPKAIARSLRISLTDVKRVLEAPRKPKR